ncbi:MAG: cytochrome c oxidase subunit II [Anaerolineaceae bacterium]
MPKSGKHRFARRAVILFSVALLALSAIATASAELGQPGGITDEARDMHGLYLFTLALGAVVFVLVETALIFCLIRFRKKGDSLPTQIHGSNLVEFIWTGIPVIIVIALFSYSFIVLRDVEHKENPADLTVSVTGFQFQWQFTYCQNDLGKETNAPVKARDDKYQGPCAAAADELSIVGTAKDEPTVVIPLDEPVEFTLKSNDVIHSFYVRDFLYKLDVIPGRDNKFTVTAREVGTFTGQCAELCGLNHALMRFKIEVKSRPDFDSWMAEKMAAKKTAARVP